MTETHTQVVVEVARLADVDRVASLFDAYRQFYGAESDLPAARDFLAERLSRCESVVLLATLEPYGKGGSVAAGFAQLYPSFSSVSLGRLIVLNDLYVAPAWRRLGVARDLVSGAVAYAGRAGAVRVELSTQHTNRNALLLYESEGFERDTEFVHLARAL
jgi:ribosomal protein S18 acetylase RimI-like enzyme